MQEFSNVDLDELEGMWAEAALQQHDAMEEEQEEQEEKEKEKEKDGGGGTGRCRDGDGITATASTELFYLKAPKDGEGVVDMSMPMLSLPPRSAVADAMAQ